MRLFIFGWVLWVLMAGLLAAPGCSSTLQVGECPAGQKQCSVPGANPPMQCVNINNPLFGCSRPPNQDNSCLPCSIGNFPQFVAQYGCNNDTHFCQVVQCIPPHQNCGDGTCDSDGTSDPSNCMLCGNVAPTANCLQTYANAPHVALQGIACINSNCKVQQCAAGWFDCDGDPANGCETPAVAGMSGTTNPPAGPCGCPPRGGATNCCSSCLGISTSTCPNPKFCTGSGPTCVAPDGGGLGTCQ